MIHSSARRALCFLPLSVLGCATGPRILASRDVCHEAARPGEVTGWCQSTQPGVYQRCQVTIRVGDVICDGALWAKYAAERGSGTAPQTSPAPP